MLTTVCGVVLYRVSYGLSGLIDFPGNIAAIIPSCIAMDNIPYASNLHATNYLIHGEVYMGDMTGGCNGASWKAI